MVIFGIRLKELRNEKNISQTNLSNVLSVAQRTILAWEKNLQEPNMEMIIKIANFFNVTTDYLLGLENEDGTKTIITNNINNNNFTNNKINFNNSNINFNK